LTAWSKLRVTDLRVLPLDVRVNWQLSSDGKGLGYVYCRFIRLTLVAYHFYLIANFNGAMFKGFALLDEASRAHESAL
jgi:hypothetical protein